MLSLTFNAPKEAFNDTDQWFFQGKSVDDLFLPMHLNFHFFAMDALPTFVCYDVMKNPAAEQDLYDYKKHLGGYIFKRSPFMIIDLVFLPVTDLEKNKAL